MALPKWLDESHAVDFSHEKQALEEMITWGQALGWSPVDASGIDFSPRTKTDLALGNGEKRLRIGVQPKSRSTQGTIRIQSVPTFRDAFITWQPRRHKWQIELGGVPLDKKWERDSFEWLVTRLFAG